MPKLTKMERPAFLMPLKRAEQLARELDRKDPLRLFRSKFHFPAGRDGRPLVYFCGNSLGLQPKECRKFVETELEDWARLGVEGHFHARNPWMPYHELVTEQSARLVGALPGEVVVMNSLTTNLHLMMVSFYRPTARKHKILIEANAFPSDQYAVKSQIRFHGRDPRKALLELPLRRGESIHYTEDILEMIGERGDEIALILLGGVNYYTGQAFDMPAIVRAGHEHGCVVGFDLAHAAGNLKLHLHDWEADFAVWCSYKYLNAGPGGIAGCFVHERHGDNPKLPRFAGWWGSNKSTRFRMGPEFEPIAGAEGWQLSNPPILQLAALRASLNIFDQAGMSALRRKSVALTGFLADLLQATVGDRVSILTPADAEQRGCQLSLVVKEGGKAIYEALSRQGVICDWREPDVIRVAPVPLYNTFAEACTFAGILAKAL